MFQTKVIMIGFVENEKIREVFAHISRAKDELGRMNIGNAHDELNAALRTECTCKEAGNLMEMTVTCSLTDAGAKVLNDFNAEYKNHYPNDNATREYNEGDAYTRKLGDILSSTHVFAQIGVGYCITDIKLRAV